MTKLLVVVGIGEVVGIWFELVVFGWAEDVWEENVFVIDFEVVVIVDKSVVEEDSKFVEVEEKMDVVKESLLVDIIVLDELLMELDWLLVEDLAIVVEIVEENIELVIVDLTVLFELGIILLVKKDDVVNLLSVTVLRCSLVDPGLVDEFEVVPVEIILEVELDEVESTGVVDK